MPLVNLSSNYFSPLFNASLLYNKMGEDFNPSDTDRTTLLLSLSDLVEIDFTYEDNLYSVAENVEGLLQALFGDGFEELPISKNILSVTYIGDSPKYIKTPVLTKRDDIIGLMIGDDKSGQENTHAFFPLIVSPDNKLTFEGTKTLQLGLDSIQIKTGDKEYRLPLVTVPHPDRKTKLIFQIGVQVAQDTDFANFQLCWNNLTSLDETEKKESWDDLLLMISSGVSASGKLQQIFEKMMKDGNFPKRGVLIPITSVVKLGKVSKKDGTGSFFQGVFGVAVSDFPSIPITAYLGGDSDDVPINSLGSIACGDRDNLGKIARTNLVKDNPPTPLKPWYLHISAPNSKGHKIPEHSVFTSSLPKKYQELLEEQKQIGYWTGF